jgi:Domain of unknown function (DUF6438)
MRCNGTLTLALSGAFLIACATPRSGSQETGDANRDTTTLVMLDRGACHGTCPIYAVRLSANGQIRFVGTRFVKTSGIDSSHVSSAAVRALNTAFAERRFAGIPAAIEYGTTSCGAYVADLPTVELTARGSNGEHRVRYDQGCRDHPRMLDTLADMVDSVSGSARWTLVPRP